MLLSVAEPTGGEPKVQRGHLDPRWVERGQYPPPVLVGTGIAKQAHVIVGASAKSPEISMGDRRRRTTTPATIHGFDATLLMAIGQKSYFNF
jgi:hypothetical protein